MAYAPDTQQGATFVVATVTLDIGLQEIPSVNETFPTIDSTDLSTTGQRTYIAGDLSDVDEFEVMGYHDGSTALPVKGTSYTVTITAPLASGDATAEDWEGTAICTGISTPSFTGGANALQEIRMRFKPDGQTAWARTLAVAS